MPTVKIVADLQNYYDEISGLCRGEAEPVFIESDGEIDLVVMSIELYETISGKIGIMEMISKETSNGQ